MGRRSDRVVALSFSTEQDRLFVFGFPFSAKAVTIPSSKNQCNQCNQWLKSKDRKFKSCQKKSPLPHMSYRTTPEDTDKMPSGIPYIIGNEVAERFSFYGMKTILAVFIHQYLWLMNSKATQQVSESKASILVHDFNFWVYLTPAIGALLADVKFGKYRVIFWLSLVYCLGHAALAFMGNAGNAYTWLIAGLALIAIGSGGIKPCVSAHVGDQFGPRNQHKLTAIYNIFYFSINLGAFVSTLLTPWLLEWYGPHYAFGVPGVLMAIAAFVFWLGRRKFAHLPANHLLIRKTVGQKNFLPSILSIAFVFSFVTIFWSLFDQTGSTLVFQAQQMDRKFLGTTWLESQIQAANPILVLVFIPLFTFVLYPRINRVIKLTPLRKIGAGLFLTAASFAVVAISQEWIDQGKQPSIAWQLLAYALLTAAEILVSIVSLEFAYTQAPPNTKSIVMSMWLGAVALGNQVTSGILTFINIPDPIAKLIEKTNPSEKLTTHPGYDGQLGTQDDLTAEILDKKITDRSFADKDILEIAAKRIIGWSESNAFQLPQQEQSSALLNGLHDTWNQPIHYRLKNKYEAQVYSYGPDKKANTQWDQGITINLAPEPEPESKSILAPFQPAESWLALRKRELGVIDAKPSDSATSRFTTTAFTGGGTKLNGAEYFWFFTKLMLGAAVAFIPFSFFYKYRSSETSSTTHAH